MSPQTNQDIYAERVSQLEREGCNTSDAQAVADVEEKKGTLADAVGNWKEKTDQVALPTLEEIVSILKKHPLIKLQEIVFRAFVVGSVAKGTQNKDSDIDILLEVATNVDWEDPKLLEDHYRQALRSYFMQNNIKGKMDAVHPQWDQRRIDLYITYDADLEMRPKLELLSSHDKKLQTAPSDHSVKIAVLGEGSSLSRIIAEGSAIAIEQKDNGVVLWFEGDVFNTGMSFEDKAKHAAGRLFQHYPTVAKCFISQSKMDDINLVEVGEMNSEYEYTPTNKSKLKI